MPAPIVMIVFNRPDHTQQVAEALRANSTAAESILYVFSDAPRGPRDEKGVSEVRKIIRRIDGFKAVNIIERPQNYGCSRNVLGAIDEVLTRHERCIIVEDDILVSPLFLDFMNKSLDVYESDESVFSIGAYCSAFKMPAHYKEETFLLSRSCAWGWATWRRAWNAISVDPAEVHKGLTDPAIREEFAKNGEDWLRTYDEDPDIWDLRVSYGLWKKGMTTMMPVKSLSHNIGMDGSGVHYDGNAKQQTGGYNFPDKLPEIKHLDFVDPAIQKAFRKFTHKPWYRVKAARLAKKAGIYRFLLNRFGQ